MRISRLPLSLSLALLPFLAAACSSEVDGAAPAEETTAATPEPGPDDKLQLRAIQLLDSATQVVVEATEYHTVETAAATLKSLGVELGQIRDELNKAKLTFETHPRMAQQWDEAKLRLRNAISLMTLDNPKVASTLTAVLSGLSLTD